MSVPVILLTGFLGSGKTTFINWLINTHPDLKISLILNEFGDIPIESQFIEKNDLQVAELKNGCMCCVAKADIPHVVKYILETAKQTQYLLVEASGLSDPAPVYAALTGPELSSLIHLDSNLCVVDALNFESTRTKFPIVMSQVGDADIILLSKVDQAGGEKVAALKQLLTNNIGTLRILEITPNLSPSLFLDLDHSLFTAHHLPHSSLDSHTHTHESFTDLYFKSEKPLDLAKLSTVLNSLSTDIIRAKGIVFTPDQKFLFQLVGNRRSLTPAPSNPIEPRTSALIFIGLNFDKKALEESLVQCVYES